MAVMFADTVANKCRYSNQKKKEKRKKRIPVCSMFVYVRASLSVSTGLNVASVANISCKYPAICDVPMCNSKCLIDLVYMCGEKLMNKSNIIYSFISHRRYFSIAFVFRQMLCIYF